MNKLQSCARLKVSPQCSSVDIRPRVVFVAVRMSLTRPPRVVALYFVFHLLYSVVRRMSLRLHYSRTTCSLTFALGRETPSLAAEQLLLFVTV